MMRLLVLGVGGKAAIWSSSEPWPTNSHATICGTGGVVNS